MLIHWIWLSQLPKVTVKQKLSLLSELRDPEEIYNAHESVLRQVEGMTDKTIQSMENKDLTPARQILRDCSEKSIGILTYHDGAYPTRLKNIEDPPLVLYYKGCLPDWEGMPPIAVVGTRKATLYGLKIAQKFGYQIAGCGGLVISGGADGIDGKAMEGALAAGKKTVAVLGFGADVVYPAKNRALFARTEKQGCLLTEYAPGTPPNGWHFPHRNRIISGLAAGVLVVEAPNRSGALNTARHAADQGRDIFVVPGNVDSESCAGSNRLLQEKAIAVFSGWDVVREYESIYPQSVTRFADACPEALSVAEERILPPVIEKPDKKSIDKREKSGYIVNRDNLTPEEKIVVSHLTQSPQPVDAVIADMDMPAGKVMSILTVLAMKGVVENHPGKCISLK